MPSAYDFHLTVPIDAARETVRAGLVAQGFEVASTPNGSLTATRGRLGLTLLIGALAGDSMRVRFDVQLYTDGDRSVARLNRDLAGGALMGGAIGASKTADLFQNTAHHLGVHLHSENVLEKTTEV